MFEDIIKKHFNGSKEDFENYINNFFLVVGEDYHEAPAMLKECYISGIFTSRELIPFLESIV